MQGVLLCGLLCRVIVLLVLLVGQVVGSRAAAAFKRVGLEVDFRTLQFDQRVSIHEIGNVCAKLQIVHLQQVHRGLHGRG